MKRGNQFASVDGFLGSNWIPQNMILTSITGGIRITWTANANYETEIYASVNSGTYYYVTIVGKNIGTYDWIIGAGATFDIELRFKNDQTILNAPASPASSIVGGLVHITWIDNNTEAQYFDIYEKIGAGSYALLTSILPAVQVYNYYRQGGVSVQYKIQAREGTLPVLSAFSTETVSLVVPIMDYDGNVYTEVCVGTQTWLNQNIMTTHYNDGTVICCPSDANWAASNVNGAYGWVADNVANCSYGAFYNSTGYKNAKGIFPIGYCLPTCTQVKALSTALGGDIISAGAMKISGTTYWCSPNTGTFTSGLNLKGAGYKHETNGGTSLNRAYGMYAMSNSDEYYIQNSSASLAYATPSTARGLTVRAIKC